MTHKKVDHHPIKCHKGLTGMLEEAEKNATVIEFDGKGITVEKFDEWVGNVVGSMENNLTRKSLLGNFTFIRHTLWPDADVPCVACGGKMSKIMKNNEVDVRQCPNCQYWTTFDQWYEMHLHKYSPEAIKQEFEKWYGKGKD